MQAQLCLGTAGCARVEVCLGIWDSGWEGRRAGASACVHCSTCPGRRGRAREQPAGSEPPPVCALVLCVPGRVAGSGFESLCPPPPPSPSVQLYPLPGLSFCPCLSWGRGMLLLAGVTANPVGRRPSSSSSLESRLPLHLPHSHPSAPFATILGCTLQQLSLTALILYWGGLWGNTDTLEARFWSGSSWRTSFLATPASHPPWPPRAHEGGSPLRKGGRGVPWQEGKWKEKLGSTRAGGQAASGPPGQAAVTRAHRCTELVCARLGLTSGCSWGAVGSPPGVSLVVPGALRRKRSPPWS